MQSGRRIGATVAACAALAGYALTGSGAAQEVEAESNAWGTDLAEAVKESRKSQRPIVAVFR